MSQTTGPARLAVPAVRSIAPYVIGKPVSELARELGVTDIIKLASNENPLGPSPLALAAMRAALEEVWLYPDGNGHDLKAALAARHHVGMNQITLGNGSNDLLVLLAEAFLTPNCSAVVSQFAFAIYGLAIQATGAQCLVAQSKGPERDMPLGHDLTAMLALIRPDTRLVYIANPNNPTGTWNTTQEIASFLRDVPNTTLVVLDEAYYEYARAYDCPDGMQLLAQHPNLVVLRTFSKAHALAGVRIGYSVSHPEVADILNRVRQPFNAGIPALVGAVASMQDSAQIERAVRLADEGKSLFQRELPRMSVRVYPSAGNFVLADVGHGQGVYEALLRHGIIVRPVGGYGLPHCLRITVGTSSQNDRLLATLPQCLESA